MTDVTKALKQQAHSLGADLVGVAGLGWQGKSLLIVTRRRPRPDVSVVAIKRVHQTRARMLSGAEPALS